MRNYKYLKYLTYKAKQNQSNLINDTKDKRLINWYKPSKERLNAYQLEGTNQIIYLDDNTYLELIRDDYKLEAKEKQYKKKTISLDYLYDNYQLEINEQEKLITNDNYLYNYENQQEDLINKLNKFIKTLTNVDKEIIKYLKKGFSTRKIAKKMKVSQTTIIKKIKKIKNNFKNFTI